MLFRFASLAFVCLAPSLSIAQTLKCVSPYTTIRAEFTNSVFKSTVAYSNENEDLHATTLTPSATAPNAGAFELSLEALDDICEIALPAFSQLHHAGFSFVAHLKCYDQNGIMVNDNPVQGSASVLRGEAMNCTIN